MKQCDSIHLESTVQCGIISLYLHLGKYGVLQMRYIYTVVVVYAFLTADLDIKYCIYKVEKPYVIIFP